ncbi:MAG: hypothetical protein AAB368_14575, partial [bacterium]
MNLPQAILDSEDGRLIGLMDYVTSNHDRNFGNWIVTPEGRIGAIDQAGAFALAHRDPCGRVVVRRARRIPGGATRQRVRPNDERRADFRLDGHVAEHAESGAREHEVERGLCFRVGGVARRV